MARGIAGGEPVRAPRPGSELKLTTRPVSVGRRVIWTYLLTRTFCGPTVADRMAIETVGPTHYPYVHKWDMNPFSARQYRVLSG